MPPLSVETTMAAVSAQETPLPTWADRRRQGGVRRLGAVALAGVVMLGVAACGGESSRDAATFPPTVVSDFPATSDGDVETTPGAPSDSGGTTSGGASDGGGTVVANIPKPDPKDYPGMDQHTQEGAEQVSKYYWDLILWGYQTGQTEDAEALALESCLNCAGVFQDIEKTRGADELWRAVEIRPISSDIGEPTRDIDDFQATYVVEIVHLASEPNPGSEATREEYTFLTALKWVDGSWMVSGGGAEVRDL
ncbi:hypothetical protein JSY14_00860 [Brachybacterium sp. EF45031]|uniref:DUF6318 family protein n=1 Tax=Brachybacterium sillae TaxID=2810536 RepID=UPI00217CD37D|nr:DUF6318 family protein [Brachybacterium sillae]MCS6710639.1 hypothetical protein [Brachybacterium sillae]